MGFSAVKCLFLSPGLVIYSTAGRTGVQNVAGCGVSLYSNKAPELPERCVVIPFPLWPNLLPMRGSPKSWAELHDGGWETVEKRNGALQPNGGKPLFGVIWKRWNLCSELHPDTRRRISGPGETTGVYGETPWCAWRIEAEHFFVTKGQVLLVDMAGWHCDSSRS